MEEICPWKILKTLGKLFEDMENNTKDIAFLVGTWRGKGKIDFSVLFNL
jgi:hypothetical protein